MAHTQLSDGTAAGLAEYLDLLVEKGRATDGAIRPLKTAFVKVLKKVDADAWQGVEVSKIDADDYITRFSVLTRGTYTPRSIAVYKARMQRVIGWYLRFMSSDEAGWMPQIETRTVTRQILSTVMPTSLAEPSPIPPSLVSSSDSTSQQSIQPVQHAASQSFAAGGLINYPFPMSDGQIAMLRLPSALSANDASRMSRFLSSLVIEEGKE